MNCEDMLHIMIQITDDNVGFVVAGCVGAGANIDKSESAQAAYLPLMDCENKLLPIHFLPPTEVI